MTKPPSPKYSAEVRARAVRLVQEHQGEHASQRAAITSIAAKVGCTAETLRGWVRQTERDQGLQAEQPMWPSKSGAQFEHSIIGLDRGLTPADPEPSPANDRRRCARLGIGRSCVATRQWRGESYLPAVLRCVDGQRTEALGC